MLFYLIPIFILLFIVFYIAKNKIHIKFKTFFKKGFKKLDNRFRTSRFHAVNRGPVKRIVQFLFV